MNGNERLRVVESKDNAVDLQVRKLLQKEMQRTSAELGFTTSPVFKAHENLYQKGPQALYLNQFTKAPEPGPTACFWSCFNRCKQVFGKDLYQWNNGKEYYRNPSKKNNEASLATVVIPKMIAEQHLPVGTVFLIKADLSIADEASRNPEAGNHWFQFCGWKTAANGTFTPMFVDQFQQPVDVAHMMTRNPRWKKRYLYKVFTPPCPPLPR